MEGSVAAGGQGTAQGQQAAQAAEGQQQTQGPDIGALAGQLEAMHAGQEQLRQLLMDSPVLQPQGEPEADPEPLDLSFLMDDPGFDPQQMSQRLGGALEQAAQQQAQTAVNPLQERLDQMEQRLNESRIEQQARDMAAEFPELDDPQVAGQVVGAAQQIVEAQGWPAAVASEPAFWRLIFMAGRAAEAAQNEGTEDPRAAHLEGGAGARPGGSQQVHGVDSILSPDRKGRGVLPFG